MQVSIKTLCDWPIYLTASADEKTGSHYADFLSLHYIVYESISCNHGTKLNYCQLPSYIHHRATYLSLPPYISGSYTALIGFNPRRHQGPKRGMSSHAKDLNVYAKSSSSSSYIQHRATDPD